jgi:hypothetical protein
VRTIAVGDIFASARQGVVWTCRREPDQADPNGPLRVTVLGCTADAHHSDYAFSTEQEWFRQRGMVAS